MFTRKSFKSIFVYCKQVIFSSNNSYRIKHLIFRLKQNGMASTKSSRNNRNLKHHNETHEAIFSTKNKTFSRYWDSQLVHRHIITCYWYTGIWKHEATVWTPRALKVNIVNFTIFHPPVCQEMVVTLQRNQYISLTWLILISTCLSPTIGQIWTQRTIHRAGLKVL